VMYELARLERMRYSLHRLRWWLDGVPVWFEFWLYRRWFDKEWPL
jgi:hypothetical protein